MNVYCLYFPNGKRYVGVESNTGQRKEQHLRETGKQVVSRALRAHGAENVYFEYLFTDLSSDDALFIECELIREWDLQNKQNGYNVTSGGEGVKGVKFTEARCRAISERQMGRRLSDETKAKLSAANKITAKGRVIAEETKRKISASLKGRPTKPCSVETKEKIRIAHLGTKKHTTESKAKISANNDPKKRPVLATKAGECQVFFLSITAAARELGLDKGNVQKALGNSHWQIKGWSFEFIQYSEAV